MAKKYSAFILIFTLCFSISTATMTRHAHALDPHLTKPLLLLLKTGGYGAAFGAVCGGIGMALVEDGGLDILGMGISSGLYAGLLLGIFVIIAPPEWIYGADYQGGYRAENNSYRLQYNFGNSRINPPTPTLLAQRQQNPTFWTPLVSLRF